MLIRTLTTFCILASPLLWAGGSDEELGHYAGRSAIRSVLPYKEGLAAILINEKWGFVDRNGQLVIPPRFAEVEQFSNGLAAALEDGKYGYIDPRGQWQIPPRFVSAGDFGKTSAAVTLADGTEILIDRQGKETYRFTYQNRASGDFANGLLHVEHTDPALLQHVDGRKLTLPDGASVQYHKFAEGLIGASQHLPAERTTLYGFMDAEGRWIIAPRFEAVGDFRNGLAVVNEPGRKPGLINRKGEYVLPPRDTGLQINPYHNGMYLLLGDEGRVSQILDRAGKPVYVLPCMEREGGTEWQDWVLLNACGKSLLVHTDGRITELPLSEVRLDTPAGSSVALLRGKRSQTTRQAAEAADEDDKEYLLVNRQGRIVLDSATVPLTGQYRNITLIGSPDGKGEPDPLLPLAYLSDYSQLYILTRDFKLVRNPEWQYESNLLNYSSSDQPEGPLVVKTPRGWGAINGKGEWVIEPGYDDLSGFRQGLAYARQYRQRFIVDTHGRRFDLPEGERFTISSPDTLYGENERGAFYYNLRSGKSTPADPESRTSRPWINGLQARQKGDAWGLVNDRGEWILPAEYSSEPEPLYTAATRHLGWKVVLGQYRTLDERRYGLVSPQGRMLIAPTLKTIRVDDNQLIQGEIDRNHWAVFDETGQKKIELAAGELAAIGNGWYQNLPQAMQGYVNEQGQWVIGPLPVNDGLYFMGARAYTSASLGDEKVLIDRQGRLSRRSQPLAHDMPDTPEHWWADWNTSTDETTWYGFDWKPRLRIKGMGEDFSNGLAVYRAENHEAEGLIDAQGKVVLRAGPFALGPVQNGMARVAQSIKSKKEPSMHESNIRFGYFDAKGKLALPVRYLGAQSFSEDRAAVNLGGNIGIIDKAGKLVLHSGWQCGEPVLLNAQRKVIWPQGLKCREPVKNEPPKHADEHC